MNNQANIIPPQETNKNPITDPQKMEIYELSNKEFKIMILKKLNEMQESTGKQTK